MSICRLLRYDRAADMTELREQLARRRGMGLSEAGNSDIEKKTVAMLEAVRTRGLEAILEFTRDYDCEHFNESLFHIRPEAIHAAPSGVPQEDMAIIAEAADNIRRFHQAQKTTSWIQTSEDGTILGQTVIPVRRAGLYVPGGRGGNTPLISSLLMTAIPAQVAGVQELAVVTPPRSDGSVNEYILAAASLLGITEIYACGSAWAIAALAFGAGKLAPVDVIAGPGNIWVSTAKRLLIGQVGIDMVAGPSEIAILTDGGGRAAWIAADMLSQAEHDALASSICVTTSQQLAEQVQQELQTQCASLPRSGLAARSLEDWGAIVVCPFMKDGIALINEIAPEHLEVMCRDAWLVLPELKNAGAIFLGEYSAEPVGDYFAGPNHVLPTMGTARFYSALGVDTFCKKSSIISVSADFAARGASSIARLARLEGLEAHARSAEMRGRD